MLSLNAIRFLAIALVSSILMLGCGSPAAPAEEAPAAPAPAPAATAVPAATAAPEAMTKQDDVVALHQALACDEGSEFWRVDTPPKRGGTFIKSTTTPPEHVDPVTSRRATTHPQVYEKLVDYRSCYYEDSVLVPDLAKSWERSVDGLTWTFKLRDDVKWQDLPPVNGRQFTSADVAWTVGYQTRAGVLRSYYEGVTTETPDDTTIVMKLPAADTDWLLKMAEHQNPILPHEIADEYPDFKQVAVGTGAFMVDEFKPAISLKYKRNPNYRETGEDGKALPYLDALASIIVPDAVAQQAAYRAGQLDNIGRQVVRKREFEQMLRDVKGAQGFTGVAQAIWGIHIYHGVDSPFKDKRVRKAVQLALDPEIMVGVYAGGASPAGFLPAGAPYSWSTEEILKRFKPDPEQAKKLLAEAGFQPGSIEVTLYTSPRDGEDAEALQVQLQKVGFKTPIEVDTIHTTVRSLNHEYVIAWSAITPSTPMTSRWLGPLAMGTGGSRNVFGISDPKIDKLAAAVSAELDPTKRQQIVDEYQDYLYDEMIYVPQVSIFYYQMYGCRVREMRPPGTGNDINGIQHAWIDEEGC